MPAWNGFSDVPEASIANVILRITYRVSGITRSILLYRLCQCIFFPLIALYTAARIFKKRGYWVHFGERLGFLPRSFSPTNPGAIWLHAVSAGEVASAVPLLEALRSQGSSRIPVYLSTSTVAGRAAAERRLSTLVDGIFYAPYDYAYSVRRVLAGSAPVTAHRTRNRDLAQSICRECSDGCRISHRKRAHFQPDLAQVSGTGLVFLAYSTVG